MLMASKITLWKDGSLDKVINSRSHYSKKRGRKRQYKVEKITMCLLKENQGIMDGWSNNFVLTFLSSKKKKIRAKHLKLVACCQTPSRIVQKSRWRQVGKKLSWTDCQRFEERRINWHDDAWTIKKLPRNKMKEALLISLFLLVHIQQDSGASNAPVNVMAL